MKQIFARNILRRLGWTYSAIPNPPKKSVICFAPHTSNCDFFLGKLFYWAIDRKAGFIMKKEWFFFPIGSILKSMGGIPTFRGKGKAPKGAVTQSIIDTYNESEEFHIAIAPEGKRKVVANWHKGFYKIAYGAKVPIQLAKIDYAKKHISIFKLFWPTGDEDNDIKTIRSFYRACEAKIPANFIELT